MNITFKNKKFKKVFSKGAELVKKYGDRQAKKIKERMMEFRTAESLMDLWPPKPPSRCHELKDNRSGQLSVDLIHPYRIIFIPDHDPVPTKEGGGLDWSQVTAIKILGVEDTHE